MSEQQEAIKLKRVTIKTKSGSCWFENYDTCIEAPPFTSETTSLLNN